jgi:hypothetical protein
LKQRIIPVALCILLGFAFALSTACKNNTSPGLPPEETGETEPEMTQDASGVFTIKNLTVTSSGAVKYISLKTGKVVSAGKKNTTEWDVAAATSMFVFRTNSGVTAEAAGSGGNAYIWYTDKTDFNSVTLADKVDIAGTEYEPYAQDVTRYSSLMDGVSSVPMNMMTYFGFNSGSGLTYEDPFRSIPRDPDGDGPEPAVPLPNYVFYPFNKKAAYEGTGGMPPGFKETKQIYIIRHADGVHHSKFQVTAFTYGYAMDLKFQALD